MLQIISGSINNAVKLDMLNRSWEQKKNSNNIFSKQVKNEQANKSVEQRQLDQFKEELARNREQSKNNALVYKIMNGEDLTPEEEQYLARNNPAQLDNYRRAKSEKKSYEEKLQKCKTKDEVQRLKTNTINGYLSELKAAPGEAKAAKAMEILGKVKNILKAELHFVESGGYAKLPTEADEAIERAEERTKEDEKLRDALIDSLEAEDESREENAVDVDKTDFTDEERKKVKSKKKEHNPLEEIKVICKRYIPDVESVFDRVLTDTEAKTDGTKVLGKINITL